MKTHRLTTKIRAKKPENVRNCESWASDGHGLDEGVVKRVTGQSPVTARHIRSKPITFLPEFKLWFQSNYEPVIKGQDLGIWRRVKKIPWNYTVPDAEKDERLPSKLRAEAPGILNWALRGLAVYVKEGKLSYPAKVEAATKQYREEMDIFGRFERDCLTFANPTAEAFGRSMYGTYTTWCKQNGYYAVNIRKFLTEYRKRHGSLSETHDKRYGATFSGVGILIDGYYLDPEDVS